MNRRGFLTGLMSSVPAIAVGAELAELLAPRRTIFLPPLGGWPLTLRGGWRWEVSDDWYPIRIVAGGPQLTHWGPKTVQIYGE